MSESESLTSEQWKTKGNAAFSNCDYDKAIQYFTCAISQDPSNHLLYSNRSAAYCSAKNYLKALEDADQCISIDSSWSKGYSRKGAALFGLERFDEAKRVYEKGIQLDPNNSQLKKGLSDVISELESFKKPSFQSGSDFMDKLKNPFGSSEAMARLQSNPTTRSFLSQPDFVQKINDIKTNPSNAMSHMKDSRILQAMMIALGVDVKEPFQNSQDNQDIKTSKPEPEPETKQEQEQESSRIASDKEKELGNQAYSKRDFDVAISHYDQALSLDPTNISILNNKAAVAFELGDMDTCIQLCQEAVDKGREIHADFKLIAKALGRIGSAYSKKGNEQEAIKYYQKSLAEHRSPDILNKLRDIEKELELRKKKEYHDPAIAEKERNLGNDLFKKGEFVEALKHYDEAIKRDEVDPRGYSNRAACYTKLASFPEAIRDCDKSIECDPNFVKAYIRKANVLMGIKEYQKAIDVLTEAMKHNPDKLKGEIDELMMKAYMESSKATESMTPEETLKKAMQDPEIQKIMTDPIMQTILQQMQSDPGAVMEHMKNPVIASNIRKLMAAGIVRTA